MNINKDLKYLYIFSSIVLLFYASYSYSRNSDWFFDSIFTFVVLTLAYLVSNRMFLNKFTYSLIILGFLIHNLGALGLYSWSYGLVGFDNIVHLINAFLGAIVFAEYFKYKLKIDYRDISKMKQKKDMVFLITILAVCCVILLGTIVEISEFTGDLILGEGEGLFLTGAGDEFQYNDTMIDTLFNLVGALLGVKVYLLFGKIS